MIATIVEILATVIDTLMLIWFVPKFVGVSIKSRAWTLFVPVLQLSVQLVFDWLMPGFSLLPMIIMFFLVLSFAIVLSPKTIWWDVLSAIAYISLMMLVSSFLFSAFSFFIENMAVILQGTDSKVRILYISIAKIMLFISYKLVLLLFKKEKSIDIPNAVMTLVLALSTVIGLSAIMKIVAVIDTGIIDGSILVIALVLVVVNVVLYLFINQIQKLQKSRYELMLINDRAALDKKQSEDAKALWNRIRQVRHDLKNHFSVIKGYLKEGNNDACCEYINSIEQTVESMGTLIRSGNTVVDYMINSKLSNLEGVQILISGYVGNFSDIADADMVCILGNILDNAVEAVQNVSGTKRVELYFSKMKQNRLIVCKNTVSASILKNNESLFTTKPDTSAHGLGHQIVENTVKKYGGLVGYFEEDGLFGVEISIPEPLNK